MKRYAIPVLGLFIVLLVMNMLRVPGAMPTLLFFLMNGIVFATALSIAGRLYGNAERRVFLEAAFLFYVAEIVLVEIGLGACGLLNLTAIFITIGTILAAALLIAGRSSIQIPAAEERRPPGVGLPTKVLWLAALVFLAAMIAQAVVTAPHGWDSYTYHIHFPLSWLKAGKISIVPTPFGDPSVAYAPCNGELFFLWLILPFREDFLANLGQLPFLFVGALGLFGIGRRMGIGKEAASWACLLFIFTPAVIAQAVHAYVDVIFACFFILAVEFLLRYRKDGKTGTLLLLAMSLGLSWGTKSLALPYSLIILVPLAVILLRRGKSCARKLGILVLCLLVLGGFWYIRNLVVTGNPLYPLSVEIFGVSLFPGMYDRQALMTGYPHISSITDAGLAARMIFGVPLELLILCSIPLGIGALLKKEKEREAKTSPYVLLVPFLAVAVYGFLTPSHTPERFLLLAVPFCALYPAFATTIHRPLKYILGCAIAGCLAVTVWQNPYLTNMVKFSAVTALGLGKGGIPPARPAISWTLISFAFLAACFPLRKQTIPRQICALMGCSAAAFSLAAASTYFSTDSHKFLYRPSSPHTSVAGFALADSLEYVPNPNALENAWLWLDRNSHGATIAWAGLNVPGALHGSGLKNRVTYININPRAKWKAHEYDIFFRSRRGYAPPLTLKPAYYRREADYTAWLDNLRREAVDYLFVTNLSPQESRYLRHDRGGFPIEDIWAQRNPGVFTLVYSSPPSVDPRDQNRVRIYRIKPPTP